MKTNILRNTKITSVYLFYIENYTKTKLKATIRFLDTKECYLATEIPLDLNFKKPKSKQPAEIIAYTEDGVYKAKVKIMDCNISCNELLYITELPSKWDYSQLRQSSRKEVRGDLNITFNDGYEINAQTYDISLGGISFYAEEPIKELYTKINGVLTLELPSNSYADINSLNIKTETRFSRIHRNKDDENDKRYVYKFIGISDEDLKRLKDYIIRLY